MFTYLIVHLGGEDTYRCDASPDNGKKDSKHDNIDVRKNWKNNFIKHETVETIEQDKS